jgi:hypothetical protein
MSLRLYLAAVGLAAAAHAGPPLTTIQDVLYKADGARFNGVLTISWSSFHASDNSAIVTQSTTIKVVDGNLRVQLVPSTTATPAGAYTVHYNSDGRIQFKEQWAVPSSARPLRVREVRIAGSAGGVAEHETAAPIPQSSVIGLVADLGARAVKGPTFAAGRVTMVNSGGLLESVSGVAGDCVRVDGTSGPCGGTPPAFVDGEAPAGIVDGANVTFTVAADPDPVASLAVYRNGLLLKAGSDYTFSGRSIQFVPEAIPQPGDILLASYRVGGGSGGSQVYAAPQVLCGGLGAVTSSTTNTNIGSCVIPSGLLNPGERIEVRYDFEHSGTAGGFSFDVQWGGISVVHRDGAAGDVLASGRLDVALIAVGSRISGLSWGTAMPLAASVATSSGAYAGGMTINFLGRVVKASDSLTLRNYTVIRLP